MIALGLPSIKQSSFELAPVAGSKPCVRFSGNGDAEAIAPLNGFLRMLHDELVVHRVPSITVDLRELYFMNSSCLKAFVSWIHKVNTTAEPYSIRLLTAPELHWQARSLATLQRLAPSVVSIDRI